MDTRLLCVDLSTQKTGIAYFNSGKYQKHYLLDYSKDKDVDNRFKTMAKRIWYYLEKYRPLAVFVEETYGGKNIQTTKILTRLQGVIYAWCMNNCRDFYTITPSSWRKQLGFLQGKGVKRNQLKEQSVQYVLNTYGLEVNDDEADAICIGDAVIKLYGDDK